MRSISISIHAPRAGGDMAHCAAVFVVLVFQSTPPVRGATRTGCCPRYHRQDFNPRPPCGGRPPAGAGQAAPSAFQSTPPVRGATPRRRVRNGRCRGFQSTPPVRGATGRDFDILEIGKAISIHAPRAGGDLSAVMRATEDSDISIHAPRAGGDTMAAQARIYITTISIHAPRAGGDQKIIKFCWHCGRFQSTPPVRGATSLDAIARTTEGDFNPRPPCGGRLDYMGSVFASKHFNPRPPCGGRHSKGPSAGGVQNFNPRPPCGGRRKWRSDYICK